MFRPTIWDKVKKLGSSLRPLYSSAMSNIDATSLASSCESMSSIRSELSQSEPKSTSSASAILFFLSFEDCHVVTPSIFSAALYAGSKTLNIVVLEVSM